MDSETKRKNFQRLAKPRAEVIIDKLRVFGNLTNPAAYEYTPEEFEAVFETIENMVASVREEFEATFTRQPSKRGRKPKTAEPTSSNEKTTEPEEDLPVVVIQTEQQIVKPELAEIPPDEEIPEFLRKEVDARNKRMEAAE